ncbi:MAG TPA: homoserine dehydrogenase [Rhodanobacteraceae bacterium]|nr:homoserine dehydrogenase [Rhodanobacteraceae bacterium]
MSALPRFAEHEDIAVVLLGVGGVGRALLGLLATPAAGAVRIVGVANSTRQLVDASGLAGDIAIASLVRADALRRDDALLAALDESGAPRRVVIDATASREIASRHAEWLARGYDVVTANKAAAAAGSSAWHALRCAASRGGCVYGDAATVGAGLPVLSTLRRLRECGDALVAIEGVFSGSLSWLFNTYDGSRPFSALLREARAFGFTEPDPRADLSGTDVARKLVILARAAGRALDVDAVDVEDLVPAWLRAIDAATFVDNAEALDATIEARRAEAASGGRVLRHVASLDASGRARVGLVAVDASHVAARLSGTDNLFALTTERYRARPLVIQGPGAGVEVTAQALLGDLLALKPMRRFAAA